MARTTRSYDFRTPADERLLRALHQPLTVTQLAKRVHRDPDSVSRSVVRLTKYGYLRCLNPEARRSRLYGLTENGLQLRQAAEPEQPYHEPALDYALYGWVCYRHRAAVLLAIDRTLQPAEMKRRARQRDAQLRMSANNVRDIVPLLLARGVIQPVKLRKRVHTRYELTDVGRRLRDLLIRSGGIR